MRKGILAIAAAGSLFAITAAGATGFGLTISGSPQTVAAPTVGTNTVTLIGCTGENFTVGYTTTSAGITQAVATSVPASALVADCGSAATGATMAIGVGSPVSGAYAAGSTTPGSLTETWTFDFSGTPITVTDSSLTTTMTIN